MNALKKWMEEHNVTFKIKATKNALIGYHKTRSWDCTLIKERNDSGNGVEIGRVIIWSVGESIVNMADAVSGDFYSAADFLYDDKTGWREEIREKLNVSNYERSKLFYVREAYCHHSKYEPLMADFVRKSVLMAAEDLPIKSWSAAMWVEPNDIKKYGAVGFEAIQMTGETNNLLIAGHAKLKIKNTDNLGCAVPTGTAKSKLNLNKIRNKPNNKSKNK